MIKLITFTLLTITSLYAQATTQDDLNNIYKEALMFLGIFGAMGIISYIYSSKHAKEYQPTQDELEKIQQEKEEQNKKEVRIVQLSEMLDKELLTQEEFTALKLLYAKS